jgi:putative oxidoreductase
MRRYLPLNPDLALLILRLAVAAVLFYHGLPKVMNFAATAGMFQSMGVPAPTISASFAILAEVVGGILILLGVAIDIAGILLVIDMLGAIAFVHWPNGFDFMKGGWEYPFVLLCAGLALALAGPGRLAVGGGRAAYTGPERRRA